MSLYRGDFYVVPTIPDILSKIGLSLIHSRIEKFKRYKRSCKIEMGGIIFTKVDGRTNLHISTRKEIRQDEQWKAKAFQKELPQRTGIAEAPVDSCPFVTSPSAKKRKDYHETLQYISEITEEFIQRIG